MTEQKDYSKRVSVDKVTTRIEGIPVWAIPGVDPRGDLPGKIPDEALAQMKDKHSKVVKERRSRQTRENGV